MTLYTSVFKDDAPIVDQYIGGLGELKAGINNFSFVRSDQLDRDAVAALVKDIGDTIQLDPIGSLRYSSYRIVSASARPSTA